MRTSQAGRPLASKRGGARRRTSLHAPARQRGYTYVMVLVAIAVMGVFAGVASRVTARIVQSDKEAELLFRGQAYRDAIARYRAVDGRYPRSLNDLLKDPRSSQRVHLRELYTDPMADAHDRAREDGGWRLLRAPDGGIAGVASRSTAQPLKQANFPKGLEKFDGVQSYAEWVFEQAPQSMARRWPQQN